MDVLESSGIQVNAIVDSSRPTTNKNTFISSGYRLLKVDTLENTPISDVLVKKFSNEFNCEKFGNYDDVIEQKLPDGWDWKCFSEKNTLPLYANNNRNANRNQKDGK